MKKVFSVVVILMLILNVSAQKSLEISAVPDTSQQVQIVEAACGQCMFGMTGKGCDLAVRINGQSYYVDGTDIDSHGDAHGADGFCMAIRKAEVRGEVVKTRFKATYFELLPKGSLENE